MFQERKSHTGLKLTGWVNYDRIDIFEWTVALRRGGAASGIHFSSETPTLRWDELSLKALRFPHGWLKWITPPQNCQTGSWRAAWQFSAEVKRRHL